METLAQKYFAIIKEKERVDIANGKDYQLKDTDSVKNRTYVKEVPNGFADRLLIN